MLGALKSSSQLSAITCQQQGKAKGKNQGKVARLAALARDDRAQCGGKNQGKVPRFAHCIRDPGLKPRTTQRFARDDTVSSTGYWLLIADYWAYTIIFPNRRAAMNNTTTPITASTAAFTHRSKNVAPRRMMPRKVSIM
jgi:hypothetical protein